MSETLHNRIAVLRAERGITRRQLATAVGVHYQTVGHLERGEYSPSLCLALRIAEFFEGPGLVEERFGGGVETEVHEPAIGR